METGFRRTQTGELVPRAIITRFTCRFTTAWRVFPRGLHPGHRRQPAAQLQHRRTSGTLEFRWAGDNDFSATQTATDHRR